MPDLPCAECGGKCCTYPAFTRVDLKRLLRAGIKIPAGTQQKRMPGYVILTRPNEKWCPFLAADGRCGIYEHRPKPCRAYGETPGLPCMVVDPEGAMRQAELRHRRLGGGFLAAAGWNL